MTEARVARFHESHSGYNTLAPQQGAFQLLIFDDVQLPDDAELVVEGLASPMRVRVADCHDAAGGIYRFVLEDPVPGAQCRIRLEAAQGAATIMENVDIHAFIQRVSASEEEPPLPIDLSADLFEQHVLNFEEFEITQSEPEEDDDWEVPGEQALEAAEAETAGGGAGTAAGGTAESSDFEIDPCGEN